MPPSYFDAVFLEFRKIENPLIESRVILKKTCSGNQQQQSALQS
jgi:hypothetical protein